MPCAEENLALQHFAVPTSVPSGNGPAVLDNYCGGVQIIDWPNLTSPSNSERGRGERVSGGWSSAVQRWWRGVGMGRGGEELSRVGRPATPRVASCRHRHWGRGRRWGAGTAVVQCNRGAEQIVARWTARAGQRESALPINPPPPPPLPGSRPSDSSGE